MSKVKVAAFSISLDGYGAGPSQDLQNPMGVGGMDLHNWVFPTKAFQKMHGQGSGTDGVDNEFAERSFDNLGAWILGRNMFGPIRGNWPDEEWKGWWGETPPYHVPVFVLTHYPRKSFEMKGGTVFHFVTGGIKSALDEAKKAAGGKDIRIGGGTSTVRQFLQAGYIDELHLALSPVLLGKGENLFAGLDWSSMGFSIERVNGEMATHYVLKKGG
ncbi:MAG: dihydrofolate reductase [Bacteroidetes bacterium]|nr:dihydrofolate reductase [Bacteroidota bacterium]